MPGPEKLTPEEREQAQDVIARLYLARKAPPVFGRRRRDLPIKLLQEGRRQAVLKTERWIRREIARLDSRGVDYSGVRT